jgi:serine/threonine protein kinase/Tol biopolymer transport system component
MVHNMLTGQLAVWYFPGYRTCSSLEVCLMPICPRVLTAVRFEGFELDVRAGELRRPDGAKARLGEQPLRILLVLLEHPGSVVLREEIRRKLWPNDTIVEFEHSIGAAMNRLRQALGDSADKPKYIETLARRGYRWMTQVERVEGIPAVEMDGSAEQKKEMEAASGDLIGRTVSHYKVLELLGSGGMGIVYKAEDVKLSRRVALKFLPEGMASDPRALERFQREALAISGLDHPNICTIYEVEEYVGQPFLVMQLLEGQTLRERIESHSGQRACFRNEEMLDISLQIASGLEVAHQKGLIHRDIKPANIFLTNRGEAKILDFGLAKLVESAEPPETLSPQNMPDGAPMPESAARSTLTLSRTGLALGTPAYLSPEQVSGEKLDARTDVYSFGLVLYEMATGIRAMVGNTAPEVREETLNHPPRPVRELNSEVTRGLEQIIHRAINKDREARYRDAAEMREDLLRLKRGASAFWRPWEIGLAAALVLLSVAGAIFWAARRSARVEPLALKPVPFTTYQGHEDSPTFSPDGSQIAFAWDGNPETGSKGYDLYVKAIGSESLLRLTHHPSEWISPAWSPDGTQIAFHRLSGADTGIYVVPALGGPERKLRSTRLPYVADAPISWSPDGKWIAFGEPDPAGSTDRIFLLSVETLETRQVPPNPKCGLEALPTFSHAGDRLAYICISSRGIAGGFELYSVAPLGGAPKLITAYSTVAWGFTWSADDSRLLFPQPSDAGYVLNEVTLANGSFRRLDFAVSVSWPAVSPKGGKLAYGSSSAKSNIWRKDLLHLHAPSVKLISSTRDQDDAQYSPDGKHIAFQSDRSGSLEIWMSDSDGNNLVQLSKLNGDTGVPRWSPDGKRIAFDSRRSGNQEIYVVDVSERVPKKLVTNFRQMSTPSWSRDGRWIYFNSDQVGGPGIYRCAMMGGNAVRIGGQLGGGFLQESFDGNVLYSASRPRNTGLIMFSLDGAFPESAVEGLPPIIHQGLWTVVPGGIYFVPVDAPQSLRYFDFATKKIRQIFEAPKNFGTGLSVSPGGHWILYSQADEDNTDIMLVDHFD